MISGTFTAEQKARSWLSKHDRPKSRVESDSFNDE